MHVGQILERVGVIDGRAPVRDLHAPPAFERREHHEQIGHAITLVFVVVTLRLSRRGRDRRARLGDALLRRFIEAYEGALGIVRPLVDFQHVFHVGDEGGAGLGRDHPLLLAMGLEKVFLSVRPIVLSLALPTICNSTTFSPKDATSIWRGQPGPIRKPERSAWLPRRRRKSGEGPIWDCPCASGRLRSLPRQVAVAFARSSRCWCPAPRRSGCRSIPRRPPTRPLFRRMRALVSKCAARLPLRTKSSSRARSSSLSLTTYFLTATSRPATNHLHRAIAKALIQTIPSNSMT